MTPSVTCTRDHQALRLYINNHCHLHLRMEDFVGFQSWYEGSKKRMFSIELYTRSTSIVLEYDEEETWLKVIQLIDENI